MNRLLRRWALGAFVGSCALLVALLAGVGRRTEAGALCFRPNPLVVEGALQAGKDYDVEVEVINPSGEPARLIGSLDYCGASCFASREVPTIIPAMGRSRIRVHIKAWAPGPLDGELVFYTDRASRPTLVLNIDGTVLEDQ
jgi:hypothetical protein